MLAFQVGKYIFFLGKMSTFLSITKHFSNFSWTGKKILNLPFNNDVLTAGEFTTIFSKHMEWSHLYRCVQSERDNLGDRRELRTVKWCDLCLNSIVLAKLIKMLMRECLWEFCFWNPWGKNFLDISGLLVTSDNLNTQTDVFPFLCQCIPASESHSLPGWTLQYFCLIWKFYTANTLGS